jgi:hypothetical protein
LYPGEFRDEYGRALALVFADRYRDAPNAWERVRGLVRSGHRSHPRGA